MSQKQENVFDARKVVENLKAYTFPHHGKMISPIAIMGPAGEESDTKLRVYAFGGCIGQIATSKTQQCSLSLGKTDGEYSFGKYLSDGYSNGHQHIFSHAQIQEQIAYICEKHQWDVPFDKFDDLAKTYTGKRQKYEALSGEDQQQYLDLITTASYTRFMHREGKNETTKITDLSERSCQTLIARENQGAKFHSGEKNLVVVDMEYDMPLYEILRDDGTKDYRYKRNTSEMKRKAKVDFVVFDGKSFGLIEFKYQAMSMEANSDNSLREHYLDFKRVIHEDSSEHKRKLVRELLRRMDHLLKYGVIDESWKDSYEEVRKKVDGLNEIGSVEDLLWCGFYFVHDKEHNETVLAEIQNQLGELADHDSIRTMIQIENHIEQYRMTLNNSLEQYI